MMAQYLFFLIAVVVVIVVVVVVVSKNESLGIVASNGPTIPIPDDGQSWNIGEKRTGKKQSTWQKAFQYILSIKNPTWTILGLNPDLCGEKSATNCLVSA